MKYDYRSLMARLAVDNQTVPRELRAEGNKLYIYDVIDPFWGVSAQSVIEALDAISGSDVDMHINSPGGSVFESRAIVSAMRASGKTINTFVDGIAASAASWIATAGAQATIAEGAFFMIHNSWGLVIGNSKELRETADLMDKIDGSIIDEYERRVTVDRDQVVQWMDDETWFSASEAHEAGFMDAVSDALDAQNRWDVSAYQNAPAALTEKPNEPPIDRAALDRRVQMLVQGIH